MRIPSIIRPDLDAEYLELLDNAADTGDCSQLQKRIDLASQSDQHMRAYAGEKGTKYYKPFVQTVVDKIVPTFKQAFAKGICPEILITFDDLEAKRKQLGIKEFGSPQDVLYGFTSERYEDWGKTLDTMHFRSACMVGVGSAVVTMAERLLNIGKPDIETTELSGTVSRSFWESSEVVASKFSAIDRVKFLARERGVEKQTGIKTPDQNTASNLLVFIDTLLKDQSLAAIYRDQLAKVRADIFDVAQEGKPAFRAKKIAKLLAPAKREKISQEQLALKFLEEGNYLQKMLDGYRLEHIQSNVKMVANPIRENKLEVDGIYRVLGEKRIVLVEAKEGNKVSKSQLYQLYETYRLKLSPEWGIDVVTVLLYTPNDDLQKLGFTQVLDVIKIEFDEANLGNITESLMGVKIDKHLRWNIRGSSQA